MLFLLGDLCLWLAALILEHARSMLSLEMSAAASSDRCSWDESGIQNSMRNISVLFLTFLMAWDSKVILFLRNWTMIFKCRKQ